jgi:hypothetical protein
MFPGDLLTINDKKAIITNSCDSHCIEISHVFLNKMNSVKKQKVSNRKKVSDDSKLRDLNYNYLLTNNEIKDLQEIATKLGEKYVKQYTKNKKRCRFTKEDLVNMILQPLKLK